MNKTDKLLYEGFAVDIIVMLVSVFSPPKHAEEIAETPKAEQPPIEAASSPADEPTQSENDYIAYYVDENGNKVLRTAEDIAKSKAYDKEFKRQEAERIAQGKAEKKWGKQAGLVGTISPSSQPLIQRLPTIPKPTIQAK